jgi:hypothetical protein
VVFYPEGTYTRHPEGWPMRGLNGVARVALESGRPVVPVAQWGNQRLLPPGAAWPRLLPRQAVRVLAGPPVDLSRFEGAPLTRQNLNAATAEIMRAITALLGELRDKAPPPPRGEAPPPPRGEASPPPRGEAPPPPRGEASPPRGEAPPPPRGEVPPPPRGEAPPPPRGEVPPPPRGEVPPPPRGEAPPPSR